MPESPWVIDVSEQCDRIESLLRQSHDLPVFFVFYATWCGPPQRLELVLNPMAERAQGRYLMVNVDIDRCLDFPRHLNLPGVPSAFAFQRSVPVAYLMGMADGERIQHFIDAGCEPNAAPLVFDTRSLWQQIKDYFFAHHS